MKSSSKAITQTYPSHELAAKCALLAVLLLLTLFSSIPQAFADQPRDRWSDDRRDDRGDDRRDDRRVDRSDESRNEWRDERRGHDRDGWRGGGRSEWRIGDHNQIYHRTDRGWQRVQGSAIDVGDGWVIGTDRRNGGFGIYRWNGRR
ncbi:MAG: hypothetical protein WBJ75_03395, partial [Pseudohongiellaceae bacterium]